MRYHEKSSLPSQDGSARICPDAVHAGETGSTATERSRCNKTFLSLDLPPFQQEGRITCSRLSWHGTTSPLCTTIWLLFPTAQWLEWSLFVKPRRVLFEIIRGKAAIG